MGDGQNRSPPTPRSVANGVRVWRSSPVGNSVPVRWEVGLVGRPGQPQVVGLRGLREVLVDEAAQYVVTIDAERRGSGDSGLAATVRHAKVEAPVRTLGVVVPDVLVQNPV